MRDEWTNNQIERIKKSMEFLIPPKEQDEFYICQQKSIDSGYELIAINEQIQNIAQKKDTLCRRMYN